MNGPPLYTESQPMPRLISALLGVATLGAVVAIAIPFLAGNAAPKPIHAVIVVAVSLSLLLTFILLNGLTTAVDARQIDVRFGSLKWFGKTIPLAEIREVEVVEFRPFRDFGGWGIRLGRFRNERTGCLNLRGNRGVLLTLSTETTLMLFRVRSVVIGSDTPERLREAILSARRG